MTSEEFLKKFNLGNHGFYNATPFIDGIGFSVRKKFKPNDDKNVSQISIYIYNKPSQIDDSRKSLLVHATYGRVAKDDGGIYIRSETKLNDPIDIEANDEYYYDINTDKFYQKDKEIKAEELINVFYSQHIKPTKTFKGLWLKVKLLFWRNFLYLFFKDISRLFSYLLYVISGNRYSYEPFSGEGKFNDSLIESKYGNKLKLEDVYGKDVKKFKFFDYEASQWSIIFYSLLHLFIFFIAYFGKYESNFASTIMKNNFLTILYVIISLWLVENIIPKIIMKLIKLFSILSHRVAYKSIKV